MTQDTSTHLASPTLLALTEQVGKAFGVIASALLVLSTAYDFSYLYALGLSFDEVPTNLADHVRSGIIWAPKVAIYMLGFALFEMFMRRLEHGLSEEELIQRSPNPKFTRIFRRSPEILFVVVGTILVVIGILFTASDHGIYLAGILLWGSLSGAIVRHPRMGAAFSATGSRLFVAVPIFIIYVGSLGYSRGESMLSEKSALWKLELKTDRGTEKRELTGFRRFSSVVVAVAPHRHVFIAPSDSVLSVEAIRPAGADTPRICSWFGQQCPSAKENR